jgi:hypothetical protein
MKSMNAPKEKPIEPEVKPKEPEVKPVVDLVKPKDRPKMME